MVMKLIKEIKERLGIDVQTEKIVISDGLVSHMKKHNHANVLKYLGDIETIIASPDYIGINPRIEVPSVEYIKLFDDNILLAIKLDAKEDYFYTASMYEVTDAKLRSMLKSGRIKKFDKKQ